MAVVGDAYIVVRAVTTGFQGQVNRALSQVNTAQAGQRAGQQFSTGFTRQLGGSSKAFSKFKRDAINANEAFRRLVTTSYFVTPAITGVIGAIAQLAAGLGAMAFQIGAALPSLIVLPGILAAIGQAALTAKLAFGGVGKAISALVKGSKGGGKSAEDALKRITDAEKRLALTVEDNQERLERSARNLVDAENALTKARDEAAESLQQLNFDAEDAAINEKKAAIELEKARETLARVQDLPPNSRARREAELAFAEADLNLRRARDANADLTKETEKQNKAGVEGSEQVLDATRARSDAATQLQRDERDANRALEDAKEALREAKKEAKEGAGGVNAIADAMKDLSPEARKFAEYIAGLKPVLLDLRAAAGKELFGPLESAIQNLVDKLVPRLKPLLTEMGASIGAVALSFSEMLTTPENLDRITSIFGRNSDVVKSLGKAAENLAEIFIILLDAAGPLITRFADWLAVITGSWKETAKAKEATGELGETFSYAGDVAATLGDILGNIFGALRNIGKAAAGPGSAGEALLNSFKNATEKFKEFTGEAEKSGALGDYFMKAVPGVEATGRLIVEVFKQIFAIGKGEGTAKFIDSLTIAVRNIGTALSASSGALPAFGTFLEKFTQFLGLFAESGSIQAFFGVLIDGLDRLIVIFSDPRVQDFTMKIAVFLGVLKGFTLIGNIVQTTALIFGGYFVKLGKIVSLLPGVSTLTKAMGSAFTTAGGGLAGFKAALLPLTAALTPTVLIIAALVAVFVLAYLKSEKLRDAIARMGQVLMGELKQAFDQILSAIQTVMPGVQSFGDVFKDIGDFLAAYFIPILQIVLVGAIERVADTIVGFIKIVAGIIDIFKAVWSFIKGIFALLRGDIDGVKKHFGDAFIAMFNGIKKIFGGVFDLIVSPFKQAFNMVARIWNATVGEMQFKVPDWVYGIGGKTFGIPKIKLWGQNDAYVAPDVAAGNVRRMALGGTVYPSSGGSLVRVAEAGRPERIEPLNDAGLSKRDIAMIKLMSGGSAGGQTFNIYPAPKMDEAELAALVSRQLAFQLRAGSI